MLLKDRFEMIGLNEVRRMGESISEKENDMVTYSATLEKLKAKSLLIHKNTKQFVHELVGVTERIGLAVLILHIKNFKIVIIQVYAPAETSTDEDLEISIKPWITH